ncbi:MAG TPA: hypothetical protein VG713_16270 [Pirellulales bacterium]|nr:hypothetical protein [Pirellulales bacterium]
MNPVEATPSAHEGVYEAAAHWLFTQGTGMVLFIGLAAVIVLLAIKGSRAFYGDVVKPTAKEHRKTMKTLRVHARKQTVALNTHAKTLDTMSQALSAHHESLHRKVDEVIDLVKPKA